MWKTTILLATLILCVSHVGCGGAQRGRETNAGIQKTEQKSGTSARLQAVFAVDDQVVWASGVEGRARRP